MNYYSNTVIIDKNNIDQYLRSGQACEPIILKSESAQKSYNGLYHSFHLPLMGDYAINFGIESELIFKGSKGNKSQIDCITNYIDTVSLVINNNNACITKKNGFQMVTEVNNDYLISGGKCTMDLDLIDIPLLIKCAENSSFIITIKFKSPPPINYRILYDLHFTNDGSYYKSLQSEKFTMLYNKYGGRVAVKYNNSSASL